MADKTNESTPTTIAATEEQEFFDLLDKRLWDAADRLRSNLDAAVYKHAVLRLIFLKYVSDSFDLRREKLQADFRDPESDYYLDRREYGSDDAYEEALQAELEHTLGTLTTSSDHTDELCNSLIQQAFKGEL